MPGGCASIGFNPTDFTSSWRTKRLFRVPGCAEVQHSGLILREKNRDIDRYLSHSIARGDEVVHWTPIGIYRNADISQDPQGSCNLYLSVYVWDCYGFATHGSDLLVVNSKTWKS